MKKTILSFTMMCLSLLSWAQPQAPGNQGANSVTPDWKDVNYAGDNMEAHNMDIYLPKTDKAKHKVIVAIYGSAWFSNNMKGMAYMSIGKPLTDAGFAVVCINHRSSGDAKYPAQINDVKGALRFIRANADKYKLDTSFIGITGFSSGGHLASMAGVTNGMKTRTIGEKTIDIEGNVGGNEKYSSSVNAAVDWFGPVDMTRMNKCETVNDEKSPEAALIGGKPEENMDMIQLISPQFYVSKTTVPFLVIHGDADNVVPYCQSVNFSEELKGNDKLADFITVPKGQHGPVTFNDDTFKKMVEFFKKEAKM